MIGFHGTTEIKYFHCKALKVSLKFIVLACLIGAHSISSANGESSIPEYTLESGRWYQLVIPGNSTDASIESLFADELAASEYNRSWAIYLWDAGSAQYVNPSLSDNIPTGTGFWMIQLTGAQVALNVDGIGKAPVINSSACPSNNGCSEAAVVSNNAISENVYSAIGSAQPSAHSVDSLRLLTEAGGGSCTTGCTHDTAANLELLKKPIWHYDGASGEYQDLAASSGALNVWESAWVQTGSNLGQNSAKYLFPMESTDPEPEGPLKAFPGAKGFGTTTPGGRGGKVLKVTKLSDDGSVGTLRWAIKHSGPRIVVFETGGLINLTSNLSISEPFITIAGQTAPGSGITIAGGHQFSVRTHDVVIRGLRSRPGDGPGTTFSERDSISIGSSRGDGYNVVVDHCSFTWAADENVTLWYGAHHVTFSNNIIAHALHNSYHEKGSHSMGMIVGNNSHHVSIHNNVFAFNADRNPLVADAYSVEVVNNYIYGWGDGGVKVSVNDTPESEGKRSMAAIGNYMHHSSDSLKRPVVQIKHTNPVYLSGNIDNIYRPDDSRDDYNVAHKDNIMLDSGSPQYTSSAGFEQSDVQIRDHQYVQSEVLDNAGTTDNMHAIDLAIIDQIKNRRGGIIDSPSDVGGYGSNPKGTPPQDSDDDGIPDWFETSNGFDNSRDDANGDHDNDGYTNIEEYINSFYE